MKPVVLTVAVLAASFFCEVSGADVVVTATQVGGDVVFSGGGTLNVDGLSQVSSESSEGLISPTAGNVLLGSSPAFLAETSEFYSSSISAPSSFGPGNGSLNSIIGDSGTGDRFGMFNISGLGPSVIVPDGYVSGANLFGSLTFLGTDFATLGLTEGVYVWSWGASANADTFTLNVVAVPESSSFLLGAFVAALVGVTFSARHMRRINRNT